MVHGNQLLSNHGVSGIAVAAEFNQKVIGRHSRADITTPGKERGCGQKWACLMVSKDIVGEMVCKSHFVGYTRKVRILQKKHFQDLPVFCNGEHRVLKYFL